VLKGDEAVRSNHQRLQAEATHGGWDEVVPRAAKELILACLQLRPQDRPRADLVRDKCWELQRRAAAEAERILTSAYALHGSASVGMASAAL